MGIVLKQKTVFLIFALAMSGFLLGGCLGGKKEESKKPAQIEEQSLEKGEALAENALEVKLNRLNEKNLQLSIKSIPDWVVSLDYEIAYDAEEGPRGVIGTGVKMISQAVERKVFLGTCSSGGKCVSDKNARNFNIVINLKDENGKVRTWNKLINL